MFLSRSDDEIQYSIHVGIQTCKRFERQKARGVRGLACAGVKAAKQWSAEVAEAVTAEPGAAVDDEKRDLALVIGEPRVEDASSRRALAPAVTTALS